MKSISPKVKKNAKLVVDIIFWVFFAFSLAFTILAFTAQSSPSGIPTIGHTAMLTVESDSMEGKDGFNEGDLIFVKVFPAEGEDDAARAEKMSELKVGDVITFKKDLNGDGTQELNTHRIVEICDKVGEHYVFQTKGDNKENNDLYQIFDTDIVGAWNNKRMAGFGKFISFLQPPHWGFFVCIILPLAGFLAYEIVFLVLNVREIKGKTTRKISKEDEELIKKQAIEEFLKKQEAEKNAEKEETEK